MASSIAQRQTPPIISHKRRRRKCVSSETATIAEFEGTDFGCLYTFSAKGPIESANAPRKGGASSGASSLWIVLHKAALCAGALLWIVASVTTSISPLTAVPFSAPIRLAAAQSQPNPSTPVAMNGNFPYSSNPSLFPNINYLTESAPPPNYVPSTTTTAAPTTPSSTSPTSTTTISTATSTTPATTSSSTTAASDATGDGGNSTNADTIAPTGTEKERAGAGAEAAISAAAIEPSPGDEDDNSTLVSANATGASGTAANTTTISNDTDLTATLTLNTTESITPSTVDTIITTSTAAATTATTTVTTTTAAATTTSTSAATTAAPTPPPSLTATSKPYVDYCTTADATAQLAGLCSTIFGTTAVSGFGTSQVQWSWGVGGDGVSRGAALVNPLMFPQAGTLAPRHCQTVLEPSPTNPSAVIVSQIRFVCGCNVVGDAGLLPLKVSLAGAGVEAAPSLLAAPVGGNSDSERGGDERDLFSPFADAINSRPFFGGSDAEASAATTTVSTLPSIPALGTGSSVALVIDTRQAAITKNPSVMTVTWAQGFQSSPRGAFCEPRTGRCPDAVAIRQSYTTAAASVGGEGSAGALANERLSEGPFGCKFLTQFPYIASMQNYLQDCTPRTVRCTTNSTTTVYIQQQFPPSSSPSYATAHYNTTLYTLWCPLCRGGTQSMTFTLVSYWGPNASTTTTTIVAEDAPEAAHLSDGIFASAGAEAGAEAEVPATEGNALSGSDGGGGSGVDFRANGLEDNGTTVSEPSTTTTSTTGAPTTPPAFIQQTFFINCTSAYYAVAAPRTCPDNVYSDCNGNGCCKTDENQAAGGLASSGASACACFDSDFEGHYVGTSCERCQTRYTFCTDRSCAGGAAGIFYFTCSVDQQQLVALLADLSASGMAMTMPLLLMLGVFIVIGLIRSSWESDQEFEITRMRRGGCHVVSGKLASLPKEGISRETMQRLHLVIDRRRVPDRPTFSGGMVARRQRAALLSGPPPVGGGNYAPTSDGGNVNSE